MLAIGALSAVAGVVYALFQHELKRLLAFHSIENIGIIMLGLGACLMLRARGADTWAALALAAALLHTLNHAIFKALLFLGAGSFERAVGSLELDRLGGLLRRMPWTGGAFLVGALAIAGVPPLNGFASEWLTLQALLHVSSYGGDRRRPRGRARARGARATAALAVLCFVKVVGLVLLGPRDAPGGGRRDARCRLRCARPSWPSPAAASCSASRPACSSARSPGSRPWPVGDQRPRSAAPARHRRATDGRARDRARARSRRRSSLLRGRRVAAPAPTWACGQLVEPRLGWTSAGFTKPVRLVLESVLRPEREITVDIRGGVLQSVSYSGRVPLLVDERVYRPVVRGALFAAAQARRLQTGRLGTYVALPDRAGARRCSRLPRPG